MRYKRVLLSLIVVNLCLSYIALLNFGNAVDYNTQIVYCSKDSHVYNKYPDNNYGDWQDMYCGNWIAETSPILRKNMAYIYFDLLSVPIDWEYVELYLTLHDVQPFDIDLGIVNEYWSEYLITWNNRPSAITWEVKSLDFTVDGTYIFDVSDIISPYDVEFSIILYDQHTEDEVNVLISARENPTQAYRPKLTFYFPIQDGNGNGNGGDGNGDNIPASVPGYNLYLIIGIISLILVLIGRNLSHKKKGGNFIYG